MRLARSAAASLGAAILLGGVGSTIPAVLWAQSPPPGPLAEIALQQDKDAARRLEALEAEQAAARRRQQRFAERTQFPARTPEWAHFETERKLLAETVAQVRAERDLLRQMVTADPSDHGAQSILTSWAGVYMHTSMDAWWARETRQAALRVQAGREAGAAAEVVARLQRELELHERLMQAKQQLRATWDVFLTGMKVPPIAEMQRREQQRNAQRQAAQRVHDEEAAETLRSLVLTFGVVAAVSAILSSPASTPDERQAAIDRMKAEQDAVRNSCPLGRYEYTGPNTPGVCHRQ